MIFGVVDLLDLFLYEWDRSICKGTRSRRRYKAKMKAKLARARGEKKRAPIGCEKRLSCSRPSPKNRK